MKTSSSSLVDYISKSPLLGRGSPWQFSTQLSKPKKKKPTAGQHVLLLREEHVSLDQLNPHPTSQTRQSSRLIAMINLVATVCGGGVLSLPLAVSKAGVIPTCLLMVYGAVVTDMALVCLVDAARKTGGRTYGDVTAAAFGSVAQVVTTATLALMLCGTLIAYQVLVRDIWTPVVAFLVQEIRSLLWNSEDENDDTVVTPTAVSTQQANLLLAGILVLAWPLLWKKDLHALRHTCYVGFGSCVLLMMAVVYRAYQKMTHTLPQQLRQQEEESSLLGRLLLLSQNDSSDNDPTSLTWSTGAATMTHHNSSSPWAHIKWWADDVSDILFAFPIVVLCFFCSYNVLAVHSQLVNPTRERMRFVLGLSMFLCWFLFLMVGLGGYLYTADFVNGTPDNIMLAFDLSDRAILAGRMGFCLTLLFGLPLVMLPTRDAITSLPEQIKAWRRDVDLIAQYQKLNQTYQETHPSPSMFDSVRSFLQSPQPTQDTNDETLSYQTETSSLTGTMNNKQRLTSSKGSSSAPDIPHLVINGVDFDGAEPVLISRDPEQRHGTAIMYGSMDPPTSNKNAASTKRKRTAFPPSEEEPETAARPSLPKAHSTTATSATTASVSNTIGTLSEADDDEEHQDNLMMMSDDHHHQVSVVRARNDRGDSDDSQHVECPDWYDSLQHGGVTLAILMATYAVAVTVPGVATVWSIVGSSLAIFIAFVVPTASFLKIRQHKGLTMQALYAWLLLVASLVAMVVCTKQAIHNAIHSS